MPLTLHWYKDALIDFRVSGALDGVPEFFPRNATTPVLSGFSMFMSRNLLGAKQHRSAEKWHLVQEVRGLTLHTQGFLSIPISFSLQISS